VVQGALNAAKVAYQHINMTRHKGEHPRMGALDVCPFIPVQDVTVEECVECAKKFGALLAEALNVPVYLYGEASTRDYRKTMPQIRAGEYEGIPNKICKEEWAPDFGPAEFVPRWGGTVTGVRKFLIAYNINVLGTKEQAHRIALNLREQGRNASTPGRLACTQGIGWWLAEENIAQISMNLSDYEITPMHIAYEEACKDAAELKLSVTGSEVVGLVPLASILQAADYYIQRDNLFILEESQKVQLAIHKLGLSSIAPFRPKEKIIEYMLPEDNKDLLYKLSLEKFILSVGDRTSAPGGGSVAAAVAALGSGLGAMVGKMTYGKKQWEGLDSRMRSLIPVLHHTMKELIPAIDADTEAFNQYMVCMKLPQKTEAEKAGRAAAMEAALQEAVMVPLRLARNIDKLWNTMRDVAEIGNINCKSDLQVGAHCLETGVWGAYYNVIINTESLTDQQFKERVTQEITSLLHDAQQQRERVLHILHNRK